MVLLLLTLLFTGLLPSTAWPQARPEATIYVDRAVLAYEEKRFEEALKELQEALRLDPESGDALYYQGLVFIALNQPSNGRDALEKARRLRPADVDIAFQLGVLNFNLQQYENAEPLLRQVYQAEPRRPNLGYYLGFMEYRKKNYRDALRYFQTTVPSDDNFAQLARFYSGLAMSASGFPRQGQAAIVEALRIQPVSPLTTPAQRLSEFLETAPEADRRFNGALQLGVLYDTNVPAIPSGGTDIVSQVIRQTQSRRKSEGELAALNAIYKWLRSPDWPEWEGTVSYRFYQSYYNRLTEFNTQVHTPAIAVAYGGSIRDLPYSVGSFLAYEFTTLGNTKYSQRSIFNPFFTLVENQTNELSNSTTLQYRLQAKDFFNDDEVIRPPPVGKSELRDALNYMIGPLHLFRFGRDCSRPPCHQLNLGYQFDYEDAKGKNWIYSGHRALAGVQYTLPWWDIRLSYNLDFQWRNYRNKNSLIPATAQGTVRRRDKEPIHLFNVSKDFVPGFLQSFPFCGSRTLGCSLGASVDYLFDNNKSNLDPYSYKRHIITTSLTWRF
jgi:tetratricopeptide (TPR) repeat protein